MPEIYERVLGVHALPKIPVHTLLAVIAEQRGGNITGAQAQAIITATSGAALGATGITEVDDLVTTVPLGNTTANQAARALRIAEIHRVLLLADSVVPPYDDPTFLRTRLGVPTR